MHYSCWFIPILFSLHSPGVACTILVGSSISGRVCCYHPILAQPGREYPTTLVSFIAKNCCHFIVYFITSIFKQTTKLLTYKANLCFLFFLISEGKEEYDVTGRATYLQACRDSGVIPVSFFHRNLQQADIDIKHHGLGPMGAKAIAIALVVGFM